MRKTCLTDVVKGKSGSFTSSELITGVCKERHDDYLSEILWEGLRHGRERRTRSLKQVENPRSMQVLWKP